MEEVRSYWQVASITHFCTQFQKPFKLPVFEPEELEQAFIIDIPEPQTKESTSGNHHVENNNGHGSTNGWDDASDQDEQGKQQEQTMEVDDETSDTRVKKYSYENDEDYIVGGTSSRPITMRPLSPETSAANAHDTKQQQQEELHLLVKLAIALLKPHFNSKISPANWESYLDRLIDINWVELENCPSPFHVPIISPEGIQLTKNLSFNELPLSDKIDVFSALCDYRFWCDDASELIKDYAVEDLRLESMGKDSQGYEYWYFSGTRLFRENRELSQDLIIRKKRIKELEYKLIELETARILKEREDKRKAELERARQLAQEAREQSRKKKTLSTPAKPTRAGLRERRSSAASNNNEAEQTPARTLRSRVAKQQQPSETPSQGQQKGARGSRNNKSSKDPNSSNAASPDLPRKAPIEECKEELEKLTIKPDERTEAWCVHCESLEEWENFAIKFEKTKSINEKYLTTNITEYILPAIRSIYAKRAAEAKRKERELLHSLATRRVSTRIISKRVQEEEQERLAQIRDAEIQRKKAEAEVRLRAELEKEMRAKKSRFVINGETVPTCSENGDDNGRYNLRQSQETYGSDFDGIIHPDKLSEFYEALELIIDTVRTSKHAWPFVDPVPTTVPGYYDLVKEPMDLKTLRTKVEFRKYRSLIEVEKDFQLLVNNCEKFNGSRNTYTKMVYKLWKSFRKNVQLYLLRDLHMDEYETFIYPPVQPVKPAPPPEEQAQHNSLQNGFTKKEEEEPHITEHGPNDDANRLNDMGDSEQNHMETKCDAQAGEVAQDNRTVENQFEPQETIKVDTLAVKSENQTVNETHILPHLEQFTPMIKPTLQFQPTPIDVIPMDQSVELAELPPEPIGEEVVVEMSDEQQQQLSADRIGTTLVSQDCPTIEQ